MNDLKQEIRFCRSRDGTRIAHARTGRGPVLVRVPGWVSHLEYEPLSPIARHWIAALSARNTLCRYDQRGCGLSDRAPVHLSFEGWIEDLEAVVDACGAEQVALLGTLNGAAVAIAYAARHPTRVSKMVLLGAFARGRLRRNPDAREQEEARIMLELAEVGWAREDASFRLCFTVQFMPSADLAHWQCFDVVLRAATSASTAVQIMRQLYEVDVSTLCAAICCPTLVFHARGDLRVPFEQGRLLAAAIAEARFVPLETDNHLLLEHEPAWRAFVQETQAFLHASLPAERPVRDHAAAEQLTAREREVLELVAVGLANVQIAARLGLCEKTVRNHLTSIFAKMAVSTRAQAIVCAREAGMGLQLSAMGGSARLLTQQRVLPDSLRPLGK
jgi:pimeloyl-ACP methyl ester carboxylesterase/DNA-binding CsgD family transcriptional regulator